jgi:exopolyphosphatase/guanosine-5'-triphosphate,3'-diphosphate pyrophosphatase
MADLASALARGPARRMRRLRKRLGREIEADSRRLAERTVGIGRREPVVLTELAAMELPALVAPLAGATREALRDAESLHSLRIAVKRLRYALEILGGCLPPDVVNAMYKCIADVQGRLGEINDLVELAARVDDVRCGVGRPLPLATADGAEATDALATLSAALRERADRAQAEFRDWWDAPPARALVRELLDLMPSQRPRLPGDRLPRLTTPKPAGTDRPPSVAKPIRPGLHRVAAIDVGSNSTRMVIAEAHADERFRGIEDFGETARLASGLHRTGLLPQGAMEEALAALQRMRKLAESHHVDGLRAVGTSALREAKNGEQFVRLVRKRTGIEIEVIGAEDEARLAFASVAYAFDLTGQRAACVDLGGGSADVVFSDNGLIERVATLPLGAVRLTDMFSDSTTPGVYRYADMVRHVDRLCRRTLNDAPPVEQMIGTGGTFTTLARISIRRQTTAHPEGRFPFALRGYELTVDEVSDILSWLRTKAPAERRKVPGLSERRSEIILAGVCVIERLMRCLAVERLRVHDGGLRDGLLMEMIDELHLTGAAPVESGAPMAAVRRLAERCEYDRAHSEHVARLALRIFDQLAEAAHTRAAAWTRPEARELLHAAAVLHDIGWLIDRSRHHKHSYTMITHAELAPLSRRQVEIIANIARYHRGAVPCDRHRGFRRLSIDDQHLVRDLAAILRVADGLDRPHLQNVRDAQVLPEAACVRLVVSGAGDLRAAVAGAKRKRGLFEQAFETKLKFQIVAGTAGCVPAGPEGAHVA